jgi:hypothetical protein
LYLDCVSRAPSTERGTALTGDDGVGIEVRMAASGRRRFAAAARPLLVAATQIVIALGAMSSASAAPPPDLPPLIGLQVDDAVQKLTELKVTIELLPGSVPDGVDRGSVLVQDVVDISIHIDPGPTNAVRLVLGSRVPDLTGLSAAEAARVGGLRGLAVQPSPSGAPDGATVRDQLPLPGTLVPLGSQVTVGVVAVVETAVPVTVPDVIGLGLADVRRTLDAAGLVLSPSRVGAAAVAVAQSPAAGSQVTRRSRVSVRFGPAGTAAIPTAGSVPDAGSPAGSQSPAGSRSDATVLWLAVLAAAVAATALVGVRKARVRRRPGSPRSDVRGHPSPPVTPTLTELGPTVRTRLQVAPHPDRGTQTFEEAQHD